jgi:hypothetical protein
VVFFIVLGRRKTDAFRVWETDGTMDYSAMSLVELKKIAKERRIKLYYVKPKEELIQLLSLPELPLELRLQKKTIRQLRQEAKDRNLSGFWGLSRGALLTLLYPDQQGSADKNEKNQGHADEHNSPEKHRA